LIEIGSGHTSFSGLSQPVRRRCDGVYDQFDVTLEDSDLLREVELTTNLIIAASEADDRLSQEEIDRILGVVPFPRQGD
jgi:hypothetical protein